MSNLTQEALVLNDEYYPLIRLHATAVFSILNSHSRREDKQGRVIGTLLGIAQEGYIDVTDCFAVPHLEKVDEYFAINKDYHKSMFAFHQRINRKEVIVGWYSTTLPRGPPINDNSSLIHDFYSLECKSPIHLVIDTNLRGSEFNIRAFVSEPIIVGDQPLANMFKEIKVELCLSDAEIISLNHMVNGQVNQPPFSSVDILSTITSPLEEITHSTTLLSLLLEKISVYLQEVLDGKRIPDPEIGMMLSDVMGGLQLVNANDFQSYFDQKVQDILMISYLSTLTKSQLAIAERLVRIL